MDILGTSTAMHGPFAVVTLTGELDYSSSDKADHACQQAIINHSAHLVIDLTGLIFMDSSGLTVFAHAYRLTMALDGSCAFVAPGTVVRQVLDITGFTRIIPVFPSLEEAATSVH